jgi:xylan 1,4-beta-xylosidase
VWNYHDDDLPGPAADVELTVVGAADGRPRLTHDRVDAEHSNAYEAWKTMGSPPQPTAAQYAQLERAGKLQPLAAPQRLRVEDATVRVTFTLPRQGVSLVKLSY